MIILLFLVLFEGGALLLRLLEAVRVALEDDAERDDADGEPLERAHLVAEPKRIRHLKKDIREGERRESIGDGDEE